MLSFYAQNQVWLEPLLVTCLLPVAWWFYHLGAKARQKEEQGKAWLKVMAASGAFSKRPGGAK